VVFTQWPPHEKEKEVCVSAIFQLQRLLKGGAVRPRDKFTRSRLKNRILVQGQGGGKFQPAGIRKYVEDLKREPNADIGPKDIFEIASNLDPSLMLC